MDQKTKEHILANIDSLKKFSWDVSEWIITNKELEDKFVSTFSSIKALFDHTSFEFKKLDAWRQDNYPWTQVPWPGYAKDPRKIDDLIKIQLEISWYKKIESEYHFLPDQEYEIRRFFSKLFRTAMQELLIVDNYFDSGIFDFIDEISPNIRIRLLGSATGIKSGFKATYKSHPWTNLECRIHNDPGRHDRFIILDRNVIYHVWASLNGIGKNEYTIRELVEYSKINELYNAWEGGQALD